MILRDEVHKYTHNEYEIGKNLNSKKNINKIKQRQSGDDAKKKQFEPFKNQKAMPLLRLKLRVIRLQTDTGYGLTQIQLMHFR